MISIPVLATLIFPVGAIVLRKHWKTARGLHRLALATIALPGLAPAFRATTITVAAIADPAADIGNVARALDPISLSLAAVAGLLIAALTVRRTPVLTIGRRVAER